MATHSSILAWRIPWTEEPGGGGGLVGGDVQPMGLLKVGHDWATNIFTFTWSLKRTQGFYGFTPQTFRCICVTIWGEELLQHPTNEGGRAKAKTFFFLFFFNFTILHWFCHISTWIRHRYTCVPPSWTLLPPPSPYHPSGSSQCTSPKHPVSCIEPGLVTCFIYDIIHVSMPFSQIIPPLHRVQKTVLYISVSFAVSYTGLLLPSF